MLLLIASIILLLTFAHLVLAVLVVLFAVHGAVHLLLLLFVLWSIGAFS